MVLNINTEQLDKKDRCFSFGVVQSLQVADTKPALIHVYDYYAPSMSHLINFSSIFIIIY